MRNLELKNLGVQEMNATEMAKIEGGGLIANIGALIGGIFGVVNAVGTVVTNTVNFAFTQLTTILGSL